MEKLESTKKATAKLAVLFLVTQLLYKRKSVTSGMLSDTENIRAVCRG